MATTFSLRLPRPPSREELRDLADEPDLVGISAIPDVWPDGTFAHLHVPGVSTRGLEIGPDGSPSGSPSGSPDGQRIFTVRVLSCAAPEELAMAVRLVVGLARAHRVTIQREGSGDLDADAFAEAFGPAWIAATVADDFAKLRTLAAERPISMPGPTRTVTIGPGTLSRVFDGAEPLLRAMRDVLYPNGLAAEDEGELYVSKGIRIAKAGREIVVHAIAPGVDYFLSGGDVYALMDEPVCHIAVADLPGLAPDHVTPVDDASVRLRALTDDAWSEFVDRARAVGHADPFDALPAPTPAGRPPGTLLPHFRPADWRNREAVASRALLGGLHALAELPLVTVVVDTPTSTTSMPKAGWPEPETATFALAEAAAVANLDALELPFQEDRAEDGSLTGLTVLGEYAAELLLSKRRLDEVHERLGQLVVGAAPIRGIARFRRGDDIEATGALIAWARYCFEDAGRRPNVQPGLTPLCFGIAEGRVQALIQTRERDEDEGEGEGDDVAEDTEPTEDGGGALARAAAAVAAAAAAATAAAAAATAAADSAASLATARAPTVPPAPAPPAAPAPAGPNMGLIIGGLVVFVGIAALAYVFLG